MNYSLTLKQIKYYSGATDNEKIRLDKKMLKSEDFYSKTYGSTKIQSVMNMAQKLDRDCLEAIENDSGDSICLLYTSPSPRDRTRSRMPSSA